MSPKVAPNTASTRPWAWAARRPPLVVIVVIVIVVIIVVVVIVVIVIKIRFVFPEAENQIEV